MTVVEILLTELQSRESYLNLQKREYLVEGMVFQLVYMLYNIGSSGMEKEERRKKYQQKQESMDR